MRGRGAERAMSRTLASLEAFFGDDRLLDVVRHTCGMAPEAIGAGILAAVKAFIGDAVPSDDVSLMVLRALAAGSG